MHITSQAFVHGGIIPSLYTCDGKNIHPPLEFSEVPVEAKSLVLIVDDPDVPQPNAAGVSVWDHWVVFNIDPLTSTVREGIGPAGVRGVNTRGKLEYGGPCPPDREHRYFFKLYALDRMLTLAEGVTKAEVESAMQGHIVAQAELMGRYERNR